ncbi:MAG: hypothetical protein LBL36_02865, partial [Clostridiales Family XIII bacterium]|nr:hypothetical protein [Clostridiales Family XIII bacterium]
APDYYIQNNGDAAVDVTVTGLAIEAGAGLTLTDTLVNDNDVQLKLVGSGTASPFTTATGFLTESDSINTNIGILTGKGDANPTRHFTFEGTYKGNFDTVKEPQYTLNFRFALNDGT